MPRLTYKEYLSIAALLIVIGVFSVLWQKPWQTFGSVEAGNSYLATTTPTLVDLTNLCPPLPFSASSTTGTLGSVNLTSTSGGAFTLYDATTTNIALRGNTSTSSNILADFPTPTVASSYHFDISFKRGLLIDYTSGGTGISSTTISYRCGS